MYDPKSAQKDLGDDFFPEGSQRAYVRAFHLVLSAILTRAMHVGSPGQDARANHQDHPSGCLAGRHGSFLKVRSTERNSGVEAKSETTAAESSWASTGQTRQPGRADTYCLQRPPSGWSRGPRDKHYTG